MKNILLIAILVSSLGCKKESAKAKCSWFPLTANESKTYTVTVVSSGYSSDYAGQTSTDLKFKLDQTIFSITDCDNGKVNISHETEYRDIPFYDKNASVNCCAETVIYSNSTIVVVQRSNGNGLLISELRQISPAKRILSAEFMPTIGINYLTIYNTNVASASRIYKLKP